MPLSLSALELAEQLGSGATCVVRRAVVKADGAARAVKIVRKADVRGEKQLERLRREKALLAALDHATIVSSYGTLQDDACLYFVLELLTGGELLWHLRRAPGGRLLEGAARVVFAALLCPLSYMLHRGILYRDLKPTNILFTARGQLKLIDFGHAKRTGTREETSLSVCGTLHSHAPEMIRGEPHGLPAQLWALGVLLCEILTGRPPFWPSRDGAAALEDALWQDALKELICESAPNLSSIPAGCRPLASALLARDAADRRARLPDAYDSVANHAWLVGVDPAALASGCCESAGLHFMAHSALYDHCESTPSAPDPFIDF